MLSTRVGYGEPHTLMTAVLPTALFLLFLFLLQLRWHCARIQYAKCVRPKSNIHFLWIRQNWMGFSVVLFAFQCIQIKINVRYRNAQLYESIWIYCWWWSNKRARIPSFTSNRFSIFYLRIVAGNSKLFSYSEEFSTTKHLSIETKIQAPRCQSDRCFFHELINE